MNLLKLFENISQQQRSVGQLPADFKPKKISPVLDGPYGKMNATQGYLVGEDSQGVAEAGRYGSRNPDTMSAGNYDRYQQDQMDQSKRDFKRQEHEAEWEQEQAYSKQLAARDAGTWYVRINGKIVKDKQGNPYTFQGKAAANKAALTMQAKPFNKGKQVMLTTNPNDNPQGVAEGANDMTPNWAKYVLDQIYNSDGAVTLTDLFDEGIPGLHAMFMATAEAHGLDPEEEFEDVQHELTVELEDIIKGGHEEGVAEGWKEKLGAAAVTGAMALGASGAQARVTPDGQGGYTGGFKPSATMTAPADNKPAAEAPKGFSKEYLQKAADPNRFGRYMISVEKAQELLKNMQEDMVEGDRTMSRAAKGYEKYGKQGMLALAKAGREGKDLDKVRDKYNKYDESVEQGVAEGLEQPKEAFQAIQKLQRFAQDNPDFTLQQLDTLPSRGNPIKPMFANANLAIDTLIQAYKTRKELGNAEFLKQLKDEINYFLTDRTASSDPTTLGDLLQGKLGKINFQQGVAEGMLDNPGEQDSPVAQAIIRRILMQRTDLLAKHGPEKVGAAVDEVADFVGDVDEIGSSDVSGWVRQVEQMLGNMMEDTVSREDQYVKLFRESVAAGMTSEDVLSTLKKKLGDYLQDVATAVNRDNDLVGQLPTEIDQIGPAVKTITTDDGKEIKIHGNEDDGFRISINSNPMRSKFKDIRHAEMATEMYCAHRKSKSKDYVEEA